MGIIRPALTEGDDAIAVTSGNNVLDGGGGSNFLVGGSGNDTFFIDARNLTATTWSTLVGFHKGDTAVMWGITKDMVMTGGVGGTDGYRGFTYDFDVGDGKRALLTTAGEEPVRNPV